MNDEGSLKISVLNAEREKLLRRHVPKEIRAGVVALGICLALGLLNGCTSVPVRADTDPWQYNLNTGYPAVGESRPWRP